ncbi:unnamed protein product [Cyclocybe aegerita]|uniref:Uncharacterized protein n=1 Tax=Cyclocybe aegerita TaxID=1973307 RepID=A0A8S0XSC9_CYCAE|nr:unnamed protein product [Cyclocybe aegerita]
MTGASEGVITLLPSISQFLALFESPALRLFFSSKNYAGTHFFGAGYTSLPISEAPADVPLPRPFQHRLAWRRKDKRLMRSVDRRHYKIWTPTVCFRSLSRSHPHLQRTLCAVRFSSLRLSRQNFFSTMKVSYIVSLIPIFAYMTPTVFAVPISGYESSDLVGRATSSEIDVVVARALLSDEIFVRGLLDKLRGKKELTPEQQKAKIKKLEQKLNKKIGNHHAKVAKIKAGGTGAKASVTSYKGDPAHRALAEKKAHQEWKSNKQLQQFPHVDLTVHEEPGKKHIIAKYHEGKGLKGASSTTHFFHHNK